jgi:predicted amidohydrolase
MAGIDRRWMLAAGASVGLMLRGGQVSKASAEPASQASGARFRAAVMRVPVQVPPSIDALAATRERNAQAMVEAIEGLMRAPVKPRLIVFPVLQYTSALRSVAGIPMSLVAVDLVSRPLGEGIYAPVVAACQRHDCYVVTTTPEKTPALPGIFFHTGFIIGPQGLVLRSPKAQAFSAPDVTSLRDIDGQYARAYGRDAILPVAHTPIGTLGCLVEAEAEVMEAARLLASKGAELIVHPSVERDEVPWMAVKQATAYECHLYLLTATTSRNLKAEDPTGEWTAGAATIIAPDGRLLASIGGRDEGAATADIDLSAVEAARKKFGVATSPASVLYHGLY